MLFSSFFLSIVGVYYAVYAELNGLWTEEYIYGDDRCSRCFQIFFLASNVMDLTLGAIYYRDFVHPLTTIVHHIFFIGVIGTLTAIKEGRGFLILLPLEISTFMLSLGTIWSHFRADKVYGIVFFIVRIMYHLLFVYRMANVRIESVVWKICLSPIFLHIWWFYKSCCFKNDISKIK